MRFRTINITQTQLKDIITEAQQAAYEAAQKTSNESKFHGSCGFAWLEIVDFEKKPIKGNTKMGRLLKSCGIEQNWDRLFYIWNPAQFPTQSMHVLEAGAEAASNVFNKYGFLTYPASRMD